MNTLETFFIDLRDDEEGASFLEYTVLLAIVLSVSIALLIGVGTWASDVWTALCTALDGAVPGVACAPA